MKLGFLGSGKMASALVRGVIESGYVAADDVLVADVIPAAADGLAVATGAEAVRGNSELAVRADALVLCVKPQDALAALSELRSSLAGKLVISIVAGLSIAALQEAAGEDARIVRVMPNTPALIRRGAAGLACGATATDADAAMTEKILGAVGFAVRVKEELLDVVTGLSGSGPAYVYLIIEALSDAGVLLGLSRQVALKLAAQTVAGSAEMVLQTNRHPALLREEVTSPGGTTIAGLEALEAGGLRSALFAAVRAATQRARELGAAG